MASAARPPQRPRRIPERPAPAAPGSAPSGGGARCSLPAVPAARGEEVSRARARGAACALLGGSRRDGPGRASLRPPAALREPQAAASSYSSAGIPVFARACPQRAARRTPARASAERRFLTAGIMSAGQLPPQPDEPPAPPLPPGANTGEAAGTGPPCAAGLAGADIKMEVSRLGPAGSPRSPGGRWDTPAAWGRGRQWRSGRGAAPGKAGPRSCPAALPSALPLAGSAARLGGGVRGRPMSSAPSPPRRGPESRARPAAGTRGQKLCGRVTAIACFVKRAAGPPRAPAGFLSAPASPRPCPAFALPAPAAS